MRQPLLLMNTILFGNFFLYLMVFSVCILNGALFRYVGPVTDPERGIAAVQHISKRDKRSFAGCRYLLNLNWGGLKTFYTPKIFSVCVGGV